VQTRVHNVSAESPARRDTTSLASSSEGRRHFSFGFSKVPSDRNSSTSGLGLLAGSSVEVLSQLAGLALLGGRITVVARRARETVGLTIRSRRNISTLADARRNQLVVSSDSLSSARTIDQLIVISCASRTRRAAGRSRVAVLIAGTLNAFGIPGVTESVGRADAARSRRRHTGIGTRRADQGELSGKASTNHGDTANVDIALVVTSHKLPTKDTLALFDTDVGSSVVAGASILTDRDIIQVEVHLGSGISRVDDLVGELNVTVLNKVSRDNQLRVSKSGGADELVVQSPIQGNQVSGQLVPSVNTVATAKAVVSRISGNTDSSVRLLLIQTQIETRLAVNSRRRARQGNRSRERNSIVATARVIIPVEKLLARVVHTVRDHKAVVLFAAHRASIERTPLKLIRTTTSLNSCSSSRRGSHSSQGVASKVDNSLTRIRLRVSQGGRACLSVSHLNGDSSTQIIRQSAESQDVSQVDSIAQVGNLAGIGRDGILVFIVAAVVAVLFAADVQVVGLGIGVLAVVDGSVHLISTGQSVKVVLEVGESLSVGLELASHDTVSTIRSGLASSSTRNAGSLSRFVGKSSGRARSRGAGSLLAVGTGRDFLAKSARSAVSSSLARSTLSSSSIMHTSQRNFIDLDSVVTTQVVRIDLDKSPFQCGFAGRNGETALSVDKLVLGIRTAVVDSTVSVVVGEEQIAVLFADN